VVLLRFIRIPTPTAAEQASSGRPLSQIAVQPKFIVAVLAGAIGYGVMNFLMTSTPIAMQACGHPYGDAAFIISSHVVGMFAPSFVTGPLIKRIGVLPVLFCGALLNMVAIGVALSGISVAQFWWSLVLLGVGWNFLYIGGTTLLTDTYRPEERAKAQGANDQAIFIMMGSRRSLRGSPSPGGWGARQSGCPAARRHRGDHHRWYALRQRARKARRRSRARRPRSATVGGCRHPALILDLMAKKSGNSQFRERQGSCAPARQDAQMPDVAKRQIALGAVGMCCQKVAKPKRWSRAASPTCSSPTKWLARRSSSASPRSPAGQRSGFASTTRRTLPN
jgi:hypothetical protein